MMDDRKSFIVGLKSTKLLIKEKKFLIKHKPWGIILFSRNIKNIEDKTENYSRNLILLNSDTVNIVEYVEKSIDKNKKNYNFWKLINNDG